MQLEFKWETVEPYGTVRAKVFGGWLVQSVTVYYQHPPEGGSVNLENMTTTFVPDPNHEWEIA